MNINHPKRLSFDQWVDLAKQLSGKTDVTGSRESETGTSASASEIEKNPWTGGLDKAFAEHETELMEPVLRRERELYAMAECAEGQHRMDHPNDPTET